MPCNYGGNAMTESYLFGPGRPCLQDRIDIQDTLSSLTFFIDNREYARARELFTEDAVMDYSRLRPGSSPTRTDKELLDEDAVVMAAFDATHHLFPNFNIPVDDDKPIYRPILTPKNCSQPPPWP